MEEDFVLTSPTSPSSPSRGKLPQIFALIIGINKYAMEEYPSLNAAVGDADAFEQFLLEDMKVPNTNITSLRNKQATREAIISGFISLRENARFKKDEASIVIYFAGHGARVEKPAEWKDWVTTGGQIELMCPYDIGTVIKSKTGEDEIVSGIPDRSVSVLLNHLSDVKGSNITLILDCCSSAGISRRADSQFVARQIPNPPPMSPDCDQRIWTRSTRNAGVAQGFSGKFHASHVLLAACGRDQSAWENTTTGRGLFTQGLLDVLRSKKVEDLTYTSLMHRLNMPKWQTPHCEGQGVHRRLFNNKAVGADGSLMLCKREKDKEGHIRIALQAGLAQGITVGSTFTAHASNLVDDIDHSNPSLGILVAKTVHAFSSRLEIPTEHEIFHIPKLFYCRLKDRCEQTITVYCENLSWLESIFPKEERRRYSMAITENAGSAELILTLLDGKVLFDRNNCLVTPHIGSRFPHSVNVTDISTIKQVVLCSAHFYHHLTRTGGDFRNVWMELKKLKDELSVDFDQVLTPVGANLIEDEPATIVVDESARLGMTIRNQTDVPLYPYLFYFDPSDLTIIEWYTPPFGAGAGLLTTGVDVPLPPKSELSIGYGDGGVPPWQFLLREGDTKDVGFFKLFLTTTPANFSNIPQESPFEINVSRYGKPAAPVRPEAEGWATKMSTIIQVKS